MADKTNSGTLNFRAVDGEIHVEVGNELRIMACVLSLEEMERLYGEIAGVLDCARQQKSGKKAHVVHFRKQKA